MTDDPTMALIQRWIDGDSQALAELLERNLGYVRRRIRDRLGEELRAFDESQDFVQAAMLDVLEFGPPLEVKDPEHFRRLLARIIENALRQRARYLRAKGRDVRREVNAASDSVLQANPAFREVTRPSAHAARNENVAWVRLALEFLDPSDREVVVQHELEGRTFQVIGEDLGITAEAARTRFRRALPRLGYKVLALRGGRLGELIAEDATDA